MISLDHLIQILDLQVNRRFLAFTIRLQFRDRNAAGRRLVGVDDRWLFPILQAIQSFAEETLGCFGIAGRRQIEIGRVAELVDGPVQICPFARQPSHRFHRHASSSIAAGASASAAAFQSPAHLSEPSDRSWNDQRQRPFPIICSRSR